MTQALHAGTTMASPGGVIHAYDSTHDGRPISAVMRFVQSAFRHKAAVELSIRTGASIRTCERWVSQNRGMSANHLISLVRSDPARFLPALLGADRYAELAREVVQQAKLEQLKMRQDKHRRLIERLEKRAGE